MAKALYIQQLTCFILQINEEWLTGPVWAAEVQEVCLLTAEPTLLHIKEGLGKKQTILTFLWKFFDDVWEL